MKRIKNTVEIQTETTHALKRKAENDLNAFYQGAIKDKKRHQEFEMILLNAFSDICCRERGNHQEKQWIFRF